MKKNGFSLIELLAVLLIIGIIALITYPVINKVLAEQDQNIFKTNVESLIRTIETDRADNGFKNNSKYHFRSNSVESMLTVERESNEDVDPVRSVLFRGDIPNGNGSFEINENGYISGKLTDGIYCATKEVNKKLKIEKRKCSI